MQKHQFDSDRAGDQSQIDALIIMGFLDEISDWYFDWIFSQKFQLTCSYLNKENFDTTASVNDRIRTTHGGPLSLAEDVMVWNITKDNIRVRMAVVEEASEALGQEFEYPEN
jgi:hypothetical protein